MQPKQCSFDAKTGGKALLSVANGLPTGEHRLEQFTVRLNGEPVFCCSSCLNAHRFEFQVDLQPGRNEIALTTPWPSDAVVFVYVSDARIVENPQSPALGGLGVCGEPSP